MEKQPEQVLYSWVGTYTNTRKNSDKVYIIEVLRHEDPVLALRACIRVRYGRNDGRKLRIQYKSIHGVSSSYICPAMDVAYNLRRQKLAKGYQSADDLLAACIIANDNIYNCIHQEEVANV
jgi:predicted DNA-binding WGR domain protein